MSLEQIITEIESIRLGELEGIVTKGKETFVQVGLALAEIKERKLYRATHENFADYCNSKWGWSRQYATRFLGAAVLVKELPKEIAQIVTTPGAAAALKNVPPPMRPAVVQAAKASGKVTAKSIKAATPKNLPPPAKKKSPPSPKKKEAQKDRTGIPIPEGILELWNSGSEASEITVYLQSAKSFMEKRQAFGSKIFAEVNFQSFYGSIEQAIADVKVAKPFAVCANCQGKLPEQCTACHGRGFVSEFFWNSCVPVEIKEMRAKEAEQYEPKT